MCQANQATTGAFWGDWFAPGTQIWTAPTPAGAREPVLQAGAPSAPNNWGEAALRGHTSKHLP